MNMNFYVNTRVITGENCIKENSACLSAYGKKCLIVTGSTSAKKCGALDDVISALSSVGIEYKIYDSIKQNPSVSSCFQAGKIASEFSADFILGIGGGSPLDASKAVAVAATNTDISEEILYKLGWKNKPLPIIAVGTTAGTGSEVTSVSVLTDSKGLKRSIRQDDLYPTVSFGDPKYTMTLSDSFTRSTAIDALSHCVESYFNRTANDISQVFALAGIEKLIKVFRKMTADTDVKLSFDDREQLYNASLLGGYAISVTGTAFPHALGYFLTENYGLAHGTACAVFLNEFVDYNIEAVPEMTKEFFAHLNIEVEEFKGLISKITPKFDVKLSQTDIDELSPRWDNNRGLKRCWGSIDTLYVNDMLKRLF